MRRGPKEGHSMVQIFMDDVKKANLKEAETLSGRMVIPPQIPPEGDEMAVVDSDGLPFAFFGGAGSVPR